MSVWRGDDRRIEVHFGSSDAGGLFSVTYVNPFPSGKPPAVIPAMIGAANTRTVRVLTATETGFSIMVEERTVTTILAIQVLSSSATAAGGQSVCVTVIADD